MKATLIAVSALVSIVFTGTVNAQNTNDKDLVINETLVKQMIDDSFASDVIEFINVEANTKFELVLETPKFKTRTRLLTLNENQNLTRTKAQAED